MLSQRVPADPQGAHRSDSALVNCLHRGKKRSHKPTGQPPNDLVLIPAHPHTGKPLAGIHRVDNMRVVACIEETIHRHPDEIFNLVVRRGTYPGIHEVNKTAHHDTCGMAAVPSLLIVDTPQIFRVSKIQAHFLQRFALGGLARAAIEVLHHSAGKCHLTGPGVMVVMRPLNKKNLGRARAGPQHQRHSGVFVVAEFKGDRAVLPKLAFYC